MKTEHFKILEWKNDKAKVLGYYPALYNIGDKTDLGSCNIPTLMGMKATIKKLQDLNPKVNFKDVKITIVSLSELNTNQS